MFSFFVPSEVIISLSALEEVDKHLLQLGERVLVVASKKDRSSYLYNEFLSSIKRVYEEVIIFWESSFFTAYFVLFSKKKFFSI